MLHRDLRPSMGGGRCHEAAYDIDERQCSCEHIDCDCVDCYQLLSGLTPLSSEHLIGIYVC